MNIDKPRKPYSNHNNNQISIAPSSITRFETFSSKHYKILKSKTPFWYLTKFWKVKHKF